MTLEHLARTIARARHGTDAMWANYLGAAEAAAEWAASEADKEAAVFESLYPKAHNDEQADRQAARYHALRNLATSFRALLAQPGGAQ